MGEARTFGESRSQVCWRDVCDEGVEKVIVADCLLNEDPCSNVNPKRNALQLHVLVHLKNDNDPVTWDLACLLMLKELRESNLLCKEDISS